MNNLQHERITVLAQALRLTALPDLYGGIAQSAANKKDTSYADFLEDVLKAERDARRVRSREILTRSEHNDPTHAQTIPVRLTTGRRIGRGPPINAATLLEIIGSMELRSCRPMLQSPGAMDYRCLVSFGGTPNPPLQGEQATAR